MLYLVKASEDLVSCCKCVRKPIGYPSQLDCPWCGCGWLFTCSHCGYAFTFAEASEVEGTWAEIARRDIPRRVDRAATEEDVKLWVGDMKKLLRDIVPGERYVYLDGQVLRADAPRVSIVGRHSHHDLDCVPQVAALEDPAILGRTLADPTYWWSTRRKRGQAAGRMR